MPDFYRPKPPKIEAIQYKDNNPGKTELRSFVKPEKLHEDENGNFFIKNTNMSDGQVFLSPIVAGSYVLAPSNQGGAGYTVIPEATFNDGYERW